MILHIKLFWSFFKIGLFAFGGGYAMIPLIKDEVLKHGWLTVKEFANVVAISQMTPGPIAVNSATFVGYRIASLSGATVATVGVVLPSFLLTLLVAKLVFANQDKWFVKGVFAGVRPAVVALITSALVLLLPTSVNSLVQGLIAITVLVLILKTRVSPLVLIFLGGAYGLLVALF
ncbi:MAG: chromate transporter [Firmicutes bacterium]|nr:chromate transporter [Bacillota bacterium]